MRGVEIIKRKRDGHPLEAADIREFVLAAARGLWPDYQLSALLMAIVWRGMSMAETAALTAEMANSGDRYRWDDIPGPKADKHSTGGVGDKTSLILAPLAAACGVVVPMMSGRGLGHSGGTLDKLESIPGFRVSLPPARIRAALRTVGVAMIGQTAKVAPADRKLYALRDVTGTVECIPLITASILSKKLAEGIDALVLDVKYGRGAFMKTKAMAKTLASTIQQVGEANQLKMETVLSPMENPLGRMVGNSLEVIESIETLRGHGPKDLTDLSCDLAARMVHASGLTTTKKEADRKVREALESGRGLEKFRQIVERQGGDPRVVDRTELLPTAPKRVVIAASKSGRLAGLHAEKIGLGCLMLGAGRAKADDAVDPAVGLKILVPPGETVSAGDGVLEVHYRKESDLTRARPLLQEAIEIE
jgi:pyrimidine-nucleoside phosphorylase